MPPLTLIFKALADPTRRKILHLLRAQDLTAGQIAANFTITPASISHHLNLLKQANLVLDERRGQNIVYSLNTTVFQDALAWLLQFADAGQDQASQEEDNKHA